MICLIQFSIILLCLKQGSWAYEIPNPSIDVRGKGFEVSIPHEDGITYFGIRVQLSSESCVTNYWGFAKQLDERRRWSYGISDAILKIGDKIKYWIKITKHNEEYFKEGTIQKGPGASDLNEIAEYIIPEPTIIVYTKGFEVSIPHTDGITYLGLRVQINSMGNITDKWADMRSNENGRWVYTDSDMVINPADTLKYWIQVIKDGDVYIREGWKK